MQPRRARLVAGDFFGEGVLLHDPWRIVTVITECRLLEPDIADFHCPVVQYPATHREMERTADELLAA